MVDLFLISPPYGQSYGSKSKRVQYGLPPLGLACINGFVKSKGFSTRFFDLAYSDLTQTGFLAQVKKEQPTWVGITTVTTQVVPAVSLAQAIKQIRPETKIVLGGPHASALPEETIAYPGVDFVIVGEGEQPMADLLAGKPLDEVGGLVWEENGEIHQNPREPLLTDLDSVPAPDYEGLPIDRYRYVYVSEGVTMPVMSGRGCPCRCVFCASSTVAQRKCRFLSPSRFVDHIEELSDRYGVRNFVFTDETFILNPARVREICREILDRKMDITWFCQTRVNGIDPEVLSVMKQAGCQILGLGIESGNQDILNRVGKGIRKEKVRKSCQMIRDAGLQQVGFFIFGLPGETEKTVEESIDFSLELPLDFAQYAMLIPLPGTKAWEMALDGKDYRLYADNWEDFSRYTYPIVESDNLSREKLKALHTKALKRFYYRPRIILRRLLNTFLNLREMYHLGTEFLQLLKAKNNVEPTQNQVCRDNLVSLIGSLADTAVPTETSGRLDDDWLKKLDDVREKATVGQP